MQITLTDTRVGGFNYELLRALSAQSSGGAEIGECLAAMQHVSDGDTEQWAIAWTALADDARQRAEHCIVVGQPISAREAFFRASTYYHAAVFYIVSADPRHTQLSACSQACGMRAASLCDPPIEIVQIPYEATSLPGYFLHGGAGKRPTLVAVGGFDSTAEELLHWIGFAAVARGWHCLIFEGPGQWSALREHPDLLLRPDYEHPVHAVVDYAVSRDDVDTTHLALIGYSLGGYLAARAAAYEPRIRACITDSLVVDVGAAFRAAWPLALRHAPGPAFDVIYGLLSQRNISARWAFHHAQWALGIRHPHDFFTAWRPYSLYGLEHHFTQPFLCLFGEDEIAQTSTALILATLRFVAALPIPVTVHLFTRQHGGASHCQMGGLQVAHAAIFDWLDHLPARDNAPHHLTIAADLVATLKRYHGAPVMDWLQQQAVVVASKGEDQ